MANALDDSFVDPNEPEEEEPVVPEEPADPEPEEPAQAAKPTLTPITRRQRAKERDESLLKEMKATREAFEKQGETITQRLERIERENAELRGNVQGLASRPAYQERRDEPAAADPGKLLKEANAALDAKDFSTYQEKYAEYVGAKMAADPRFRPPAPQSQAQGPSPMLQMVLSQFVDVVSDPDAFDWAQAYDRRLARQGIPEGPQRWQQALAEGRRILGTKGKPGAPTYSTKSREVLSGTPRAGSSSGDGAAGGGEQGVVLSALERSMAKKFKMTEQEYAQHVVAMHPERVQQG